MNYYKPDWCFVVNLDNYEFDILDFKQLKYPWKIYSLSPNYVNKQLFMKRAEIFKHLVFGRFE